jgi:hypothetical protein
MSTVMMSYHLSNCVFTPSAFLQSQLASSVDETKTIIQKEVRRWVDFAGLQIDYFWQRPEPAEHD